MLSLILTALLGLFCCGGSIYNRLSNVSNGSNMIVNSSDSSISTLSGECTENYVCDDSRESPNSKYFGVVDEEGIQLTINAGDFTGSYFFEQFIFGASRYYDSSIRANNATNGRWDFFPSSSELFTYNYANGAYTKVNDINWYVLEKTFYFTTSGGINVYDYLLSIYSNQTLYLKFYYHINVPQYDVHNEWDLGFQVIDCGISDNNVGSNTFCIRENNNGGVSPFIQYAYTYYSDNIMGNDYTYNTGYERGYNDGWALGRNNGYNLGYGEGYSAGASSDSVASTIFTGFLDVSLIPVNVFLTIFNFEVFGINIAGIVSGLLTLSVVIIIFRFLFGGKKDD